MNIEDLTIKQARELVMALALAMAMAMAIAKTLDIFCWILYNPVRE